MTFHNLTLKNSKLANQTFVVGGYLRDSALGIPSNDVDYVITCDRETFKYNFPESEPVGESFPVYLIEGDEVALSRTEESSGHGYGNFNVTGLGVSIEEDLSRRDFTFNAIAQNIVTGEIVDPFCGLIDLRKGIVRTTYRDSFKDDPVRILRALRFASRFNFVLADETVNQIQKFRGELKYVTKERIVLELTKVWEQAETPSNYIRELLRHDINEFIIPGIAKIDNTTLDQIDEAKRINAPFHIFIALVMKNELNAQVFLSDHKFTKLVNSFVPKIQKLELNKLTELNSSELAQLTLEIGKRDFHDIYKIASLNKLSEKEKALFETINELLFQTDFSWLENVKPKQRANRAFEFRKKLFTGVINNFK